MTPKNGRTAKIENNTDTESQSGAETPAGEDRAATVARVAYEKWQARGCPNGDDERDWFEAEQEVLTASGPAATYNLRAPLSKPSMTS